MNPADRINNIEEYYFSKKLAEIKAMQEKGINIINLGVGNPDFPTPPEVLKELVNSAYQEESNYYQSYRGLDKLREAFSDWYKQIYQVTLNPKTEILPLMGSKEAIMHIQMAFCNPQDKVLIPSIGYPAYSAVAKLLNLDIQYYHLKEENDWLPDFNELEMLSKDGCKLMWVNYPHMPTGKIAKEETLRKLITFATKKNILLINDNPYSLILNTQPESILSYCNRNDNVMELNSLSKSHNMAGWRVGMVAGSEININHILKVKSNFDSGMFKPIQEAAVKALQLSTDWYDSLNTEYAKRRNTVWKLLDQLECTYSKEAAGMFVWAHIPEKYKTGEELSDYLLYEKGIFAAPGSVFGESGKKYLRFSLCAPNSVIEEAINRLSNKKTNIICE